MKKILLLATSLFIGGATYSQFTQSNTPTDGDGVTLYVIDSMAPNMSNETGANANWDYSSYAGYNGEDRNITGLDATASTHASSFPNATDIIEMEGFLSSFVSSSSTGLTGYGFVYTEPTVGEIVAKYDVDDAELYNFPMDENSPMIVDSIKGELEYTMPGVGAQTANLTGKMVAQVDGKGTLTLADNPYTDVLRYKVVDTINTTLLIVGDVQMIRVQYEYYDHSENNLPIFVHTTFDFNSVGGSTLSSAQLVMSYEDPSDYVGLSKNELEETKVYPVPATEELNIELPISVEAGKVTITDVQGREVYSSILNSAVKTIDVAHLNKGMYIVNISNENTSISKNIIIK